MKVTKNLLLNEEKKLLKNAFYVRLIFLGFFALPLISILVFLFLEEKFFIMSIVFLLLLFISYKFVYPFYMQSKKNLLATHKLVVETKVLNIEKQFRKRGFRFILQTEYNTIDSWSCTLHKTTLTFDKLFNGMLIELHLLENNKVDLLEMKQINP